MKLSLVLLSVLFSANAMAQYTYGERGYTPQCAVREDRTNLCLGDHVIAYDTNPNDGYTTPFENRPGVVLEIYSNNVALVRMDDGSGNFTIDLGSLAREVPSLYGYDRGDRVQLEWSSRHRGTVYHVYENGEVQVVWDKAKWGTTYVSIDDLDMYDSYPTYGYPNYPVRPYDYSIVAWNFGPMPGYGYYYRPYWASDYVYYNYGWNNGIYYGYFPGYYYPYGSGVWFVIHPAQPYHCGPHAGWNYGSYPYGTKGYRDYGVYNRRGSWGGYGSGYDLNGSRRAARGYDAQTWNTQTRGGQRFSEAPNATRSSRSNNGYTPNTNNGNRGRDNNNGGYTPNTNNGNRGGNNGGRTNTPVTPNTNSGNRGGNNGGRNNAPPANNGGGNRSSGGTRGPRG